MSAQITLTRRAAVATAVCLMLAGSIGAGVVSAFLVPAISNNRETIEAIVSAQRRECENDHKFRIQYKVRGEAEKKLLALFLELARQNLEAGGPDAALNRDFIEEFQPLLDRIRIIPPPNCERQAERLQDSL